MTDPSENSPRVRVDDLRKLARPETFFSLWLKSRKIIYPRRKLYVGTEIAAGLTCGVGAQLSAASAGEIGKVVRDVADKFFSFDGAVLGIIIAAFAIFSTVSQSKMVGWLAEQQKKDGDVLELQRIALHFVAAFVPYLEFAMGYALLQILGWYGGPVTRLVIWLDSKNNGSAHFLAAVCLALLGWAIVRLLWTLASLITNVYSAFMLLSGATIADTAEIVDEPDPKTFGTSKPQEDPVKSPADSPIRRTT